MLSRLCLFEASLQCHENRLEKEAEVEEDLVVTAWMARLEMIGARKEQKVAENVALLALNDFAIAEHPDKLVPLNIVLAIDGQFEHLLPDRVVGMVHFVEEREFEAANEFSAGSPSRVLEALTWLGTALLNLLLYRAVVVVGKRAVLRVLPIIGQR